MARNSTTTRRIFGGKEPQGTFAEVGSAAYARPLNNPADQATAETLAVGTHRRVIPGPAALPGMPWWSYHIDVVTAAGATSALNIFYSWLPNPDPTVAAHWEASGISALDLTATTDVAGTIIEKAPAWILFEAVVANSAGTIFGYARCSGVEV